MYNSTMDKVPIPHDKIIEKAKKMSSRVVEAMGISDCSFFLERFDKADMEDVLGVLEQTTSGSIAVSGDWRDSPLDIYDVVVRYAEDNFSRIRSQKFAAGVYVVVMTGRLKESLSTDEN